MLAIAIPCAISHLHLGKLIVTAFGKALETIESTLVHNRTYQ